MPDKELSPESARRMVSAVVPALKELDSELLAYQMALTTLKSSVPNCATTFEGLLTVAKFLPSYEKTLSEKYDQPLEQFSWQHESTTTWDGNICTVICPSLISVTMAAKSPMASGPYERLKRPRESG